MNCAQFGVSAHRFWHESALWGREDRRSGRSEATQAKFLKQEGCGGVGVGGGEEKATEPGGKYWEKKRRMALC